jgi:hypothetical protein
MYRLSNASLEAALQKKNTGQWQELEPQSIPMESR